MDKRQMSLREKMEHILLFSCSVVSDSLPPHILWPPGSSVHGISQARIQEWVAISSFRGSSWLRDWTTSPALQTGSLPLRHQEGPWGCLVTSKGHKHWRAGERSPCPGGASQGGWTHRGVSCWFQQWATVGFTVETCVLQSHFQKKPCKLPAKGKTRAGPLSGSLWLGFRPSVTSVWNSSQKALWPFTPLADLHTRKVWKLLKLPSFWKLRPRRIWFALPLLDF